MQLSDALSRLRRRMISRIASVEDSRARISGFTTRMRLPAILSLDNPAKCIIVTFANLNIWNLLWRAIVVTIKTACLTRARLCLRRLG